jgi:uncharacterized protein YndB with AHSA1/START domain
MAREAIVIERVLPAPPETVFAAWGDAASLRAWMTPGTAHDASVEVDFRVGGRFRIVMHDAERDFAHHGEYLELDPPERILMTWISEWAPAGEQRTLLRVELERVGRSRTRLVLTHSELPEGPRYDGHARGWGEILEKLERAIAQGDDACR